MSAPDRMVLADAAAVAEEGARRFVIAARESLARRGRFYVALSGGSTPRGMYERLARLPHRDTVDWSRVVVFFGDERTVPPVDRESNFRMASDALLLHVPAEVHRILGERPPEEAARAYEDTIRRAGPRDLLVPPGAAANAGLPRFDLVLLGMGPDGHTASLFPRTPALAVRDRLVVPNRVDQLATWRVTMTAPLLNAARAVLVLVAGAEKAPVLRALAAGPPDPDEHPILLIQPEDGTLTWLVDRAAAA